MTNPFWYTFSLKFNFIIPYPYFMLYDPGANVSSFAGFLANDKPTCYNFITLCEMCLVRFWTFTFLSHF